jgi:isopenicillin N synthase-like dioxygenase
MKGNPLQIVDVSKIDNPTGELLLNAASTQGFLFIEGHGFTQHEVDLLFDCAREFFDLPLEYKRSYSRTSSNYGYDYCGENLDPKTQKKADPKELINFDVFGFLNSVDPLNLPDWFVKNPTKFQLIKLIIEKLSKLSLKLLQLLALGLALDDPQWFDTRYDPSEVSGSTFRMLHYPGSNSIDPDNAIRAGAHTDYGSMTLLFQKENQEGLEIYSPILKQWEAVPFISANTEKFPGQVAPIIVNIADQLSYWTAGILKSTIHRVKFSPEAQRSGKSRYSIVFFSHPRNSALLEPVPSKIVSQVKGRGVNKQTVPLTAKQHLDKRLAETYK